MTPFYFQENVVNIFTDASTKTIGNVNYVCSGFVVIQNNMKIASDYVVFKDVTSQFGELYAIMMGLTYLYNDIWMKRNTGRYDEVNNTIYNLFSDSLYSLNCLRSWISNWVNITNYSINHYQHPTYNYDDQTAPLLVKINTPNKKIKKNRQFGLVEVKNQEVILHCMGLIVSTQVPIHMYHIKGHSSYNAKSLGYAKNLFYQNPNVEITDNIPMKYIKDMIYWNNMIDDTTRKHLENVLKQSKSVINTPVWPVKFYPTREQQSIYQNFIR